MIMIMTEWGNWASLMGPVSTKCLGQCLGRCLGRVFGFAGAEGGHRGPQPDQAQGARASGHDRIRKTG